MYTPKLYIKDKKADNSLILLSVAYNNTRTRISTKISIPPKYWNDKTQAVKEHREFPRAKEINRELQDTLILSRKAIEFFESQDICPTSSQIKDKYLEILISPKKKQNPNEFWRLFDKFLIERGEIVSQKTIVHYDKSLRKHLLATEKWSGIPLSFSSLKADGGFIKKLEQYLTFKAKGKIEGQGAALNTIGKQNKNIKSFLNWCFDFGHCEMFSTKHIRTHQEIVDNVYITEDELDRLIHYNFKDEELVKVRDLFLIGCYTGLRISDLNRLVPGHFVGENIFIIPQKSKIKVPLKIPVISIIQPILQKYDNNPPKFDDLTDLNVKFREICEIAGFDDNVVIHRDRNGNKKEEFYKKFQLVTSHTCRRSFCTNLFVRKLPVRAIMAMSGHKTERSFTTYLKKGNDEIVEIFREEITASYYSS
jgi:integrase